MEEINNSKKKNFRIEKTVYQDQRKVIDIEQDKAIFTITFSDEIGIDEKEEIMVKINNALNT